MKSSKKCTPRVVSTKSMPDPGAKTSTTGKIGGTANLTRGPQGGYGKGGK